MPRAAGTALVRLGAQMRRHLRLQDRLQRPLDHPPQEPRVVQQRRLHRLRHRRTIALGHRLPSSIAAPNPLLSWRTVATSVTAPPATFYRSLRTQPRFGARGVSDCHPGGRGHRDWRPLVGARRGDRLRRWPNGPCRPGQVPAQRARSPRRLSSRSSTSPPSASSSRSSWSPALDAAEPIRRRDAPGQPQHLRRRAQPCREPLSRVDLEERLLLDAFGPPTRSDVVVLEPPVVADEPHACWERPGDHAEGARQATFPAPREGSRERQSAV